jgi:hypothetical protein
MQFLWPLILKMGIVLFAMLVAAFVLRRLLKRWERHSKERAKVARCRCGYPLEGLALARCPECGRVLHFNATAEELGLSEAELRRAIEVKKRREAADRAAAAERDATGE